MRAVLAFFVISSAVLFSASPAHALDPQGPSVLVFANSNCTNASASDITNTITTIASSVTVFDGGNGTGSAWQTALAGIDVLVFPEAETTAGNVCTLFSAPHIDSSAQQVIKAWVESGKIIVGTGSYTHTSLVNYLSGLNFNSEFSNVSSVSNWLRVSGDSSLPASVPLENVTLGLVGFNLWSTEKKSLVTPVYYRETITVNNVVYPENNVGVGYFTFGSGYYIYNAWDWFKAQSPSSQQLQDYATWDATLKFAVKGQISPNPALVNQQAPASPVAQVASELAKTGSPLVPVGLASMGLIALGVLLKLARRTRQN